MVNENGINEHSLVLSQQKPASRHAVRPSLIARWISATTPHHIQPHTLAEREILRKGRLLSISLLRAIVITLPIFIMFSIPHLTIISFSGLGFYAMIVLALCFNSRGHFIWAALCYLSSCTIMVLFVSQALPPSLRLIGWICLSAIPTLLAGLYLWPWTPLGFAGFNGIMTAILLQQPTNYPIAPTAVGQFIALIYFFQAFMALNGMTYAKSTNQAVIEADRTAELELANLRLAKMATIDPITQIANHRAFADTFAHMFAADRVMTQTISLIFTDLDRFKQINDTWGHQSGDLVLAHVARTLHTQVASIPKVLVARYGGEEFVVLLPDIEQRAAVQIAEDIRAAIAAQGVSIEGIGPNSVSSIPVTLSLGVASYPQDATTAADLIAAADAAMYAAKHQGRNRVCTAQAGQIDQAAA